MNVYGSSATSTIKVEARVEVVVEVTDWHDQFHWTLCAEANCFLAGSMKLHQLAHRKTAD